MSQTATFLWPYEGRPETGVRVTMEGREVGTVTNVTTAPPPVTPAAPAPPPTVARTAVADPAPAPRPTVARTMVANERPPAHLVTIHITDPVAAAAITGDITDLGLGRSVGDKR